MKPAWPILRIANIQIRLHATFPLLLLWVALYQYDREHSWALVAEAIGFTLLLFVIIVLHELGHALMARHYGIRTRDITLLPIGGIARMDRLPEKPGPELMVALAGPAVNVALAAACFVVLGLQQGIPGLPPPLASGASWVNRLFWVNLSLAAFNLLPAFPMDGGRVLRALLAMKFDYLRATKIAATIGQGLAVVLAFAGLLGNPLLVLIAVFIWIGAGTEAEATWMRSVLVNVPVSAVMLTDFRTFAPGESLARAVNYLLASSQQDFPVCDEQDRPVGVLRRADVLRGLTEQGANARVDDVMLREFVTAEASETVEGLFTRCENLELDTVPVLRDGRLAGLFTPSNLGEYVLVQFALAGTAAEPPVGEGVPRGKIWKAIFAR